MNNSNIDYIFYVLDSFSLNNGNTIFCGKVVGNCARILPGEYDLYVDDKAVRALTVTGEMMPKKISKNELRSINILGQVDLSRDLLGMKNIKLVPSN